MFVANLDAASAFTETRAIKNAIAITTVHAMIADATVHAAGEGHIAMIRVRTVCSVLTARKIVFRVWLVRFVLFFSSFIFTF